MIPCSRWLRWVFVIPALAVAFGFAAAMASVVPRLLVLPTSAHGLSLADYTAGPIRTIAPLSPRIVQDVLRDALVHTAEPASSSKAPTAASTATAQPSSGALSPVPTPTPSPTPSPSPSPSVLSLPTILPAPTPSPSPTPTPTPTSACTGSASIVGQVVDTATGLGIANASVSLSACAPATTTDINGNFRFVNLPTGSYTVSASATGYYANSQTVSVSGGQKLSVTIKLTGIAATGGITGQVVDSVTGLPVVGATVSLGPGLVTVTDLSGSYSLALVPFGNYTMTVSALNYQSQSLAVTIDPGKTTTQNVLLVHL